jgi:hypothetical protein
MMYLGVVTELRNDGTVPGRLRDRLDLRDVPQKEYFGAFRFRDGSPIQTLGPGLTEQLVFAWQLPESVVTSVHSVTIRVWKKNSPSCWSPRAARSGSTIRYLNRSPQMFQRREM